MGRRIAFVGECMVELNAAPELGADVMRQTFGGDSLNACVYCRRALGQDEAVTVHYVTRLGDDPFSIAMLKAWRAEGLNTDLVEQGRGETARVDHGGGHGQIRHSAVTTPCRRRHVGRDRGNSSRELGRAT